MSSQPTSVRSKDDDTVSIPSFDVEEDAFDRTDDYGQRDRA